MAVRNIKRECRDIEQGETPSKQAHPTWTSLPQQEQMDNDTLIIGFIFEA
jgi:hypothetical protein